MDKPQVSEAEASQQPEPGSIPGVDPTKTHIAKAHKHDSPLVSCRFDPSGRFVFFGAQDYKVWRWDWETDAKVELAAHDSWVRGLAFDPTGDTVITAGYDGRLIWWPARADKPEPIRVIEKAHDGWVRAVAASPDGRLVATAGNDRLVKVWSLLDGSLVHELYGHESHAYNVAFHPEGERLVSGDLKANLNDWDLSSGDQIRTFQAEALHKYDSGFKADIGGFRGLVFSSDGKQLAGSGITNVTNAFAGVGNPAVVVFDWESGEQKTQHVSKAKHKGVAWGVAFHPNHFVIGISGGSSGGYLLFWKPGEEQEFHQHKLPNTARDLDLAPDGMHVATIHYDKHVRIGKLSGKT